MNFRNILTHLALSGLQETTPLSEKKRIILLNQMALVLIFTISYFLFCAVRDNNPIDVVMDVFVLLFSCSLIQLQRGGNYRLARILMVVVTPVLISLFAVLFGPKAGTEVLYIIPVLSIIFFFPEKKDRSFLLAWVLISFITALVLSSFYGNPFAHHIKGAGRIILLVFTCICSYLMLRYYLRENTLYELRTERLVKQLEGKNHELKELNEELERYFHIATHDLKTPLRTTIGFLGLIKRKINKNQTEDLLEYADLAHKGGEQMLEKINHLLTYSKVSQKKENPVWIDLKEMLCEYSFHSQQYLNATMADLKVNTNVMIKGKPFQIYSLFQNLIENGIKYNQEEQPCIEISQQKKGNKLLIVVKDNGIGIDNKNQEKVFEMFGRLHTDAEYEGTGIGLAMCKKIVQLHGGKIWLESELDKGSSFFLEFPEEMIEIKREEILNNPSILAFTIMKPKWT